MFSLRGNFFVPKTKNVQKKKSKPSLINISH